MKQRTERLYHWGLQKASSDRAVFWLALLFFLEIFLLIPLDAVLMFFCLQKRNQIWRYILVASIASTASGLIGYLVGHFLWDLIGGWVVPYAISAPAFERISSHIQEYEHSALFLGALLPFPLKILSLASGVFQLGIGSFAACFSIARFVRFSLIGGAMAVWGEKVKSFIDRHFHRLFLLVGAKIALGTFFFWFLAR